MFTLVLFIMCIQFCIVTIYVFSGNRSVSLLMSPYTHTHAHAHSLSYTQTDALCLSLSHTHTHTHTHLFEHKEATVCALHRLLETVMKADEHSLLASKYSIQIQNTITGGKCKC